MTDGIHRQPAIATSSLSSRKSPWAAIRGLWGAVALVVLAATAGPIGCGNGKTQQADEEPDFSRIAVAIRQKVVESPPEYLHGKWYRERFLPQEVHSFITPTHWKHRPWQAKVTIVYRREYLSEPAETREAAASAKLDGHSVYSVLAWLVFQDGRWRLESLQHRESGNDLMSAGNGALRDAILKQL